MTRPTDWDVLDLSADPTPGDPTVVSRLAHEWDRVADDAEAAARGVRSLAADGAVLEWLGMAGDSFRGPLAQFPEQLAKCEDSYRQGAAALRTWSKDLDGAQADADRALALGREAKADLSSAQAVLGSATSAAATAQSHAQGLSEQQRAQGAGSPPSAAGASLDPDAVRSAVRTAQVAQAARARAQADVGDAQQRLDAARRLALQAKDLRESRGKVAAKRIDDAAHAGIKPNSFLHDLGHIAGQVWDAVVKIAKVLVAVLGIIALIVGGPLAWVVVAAAVLVLADTIAKAAKGEASGWDVAFAALNCIPGTKGLTTATDIFKAAAEGASFVGKTAKVATHLGGAVVKAGKGLTVGVKAAPGMVASIARSDGHGIYKLQRMTMQVVHGVPGTASAFNRGFADSFAKEEGSLLRRVLVAGDAAEAARAKAFKNGFSMYVKKMAMKDPVAAARLKQGDDAYPGMDGWMKTQLGGKTIEQGYPWPGEYGVPEGTSARHDFNAREYNDAVQVGSHRPDGSGPATYRDQVITYRFHDDADAPGAVSVTAANPQYGAGGQEQVYVPDLLTHVLEGRADPLDVDGNVLTLSPDDKGNFLDDEGKFMFTNDNPNLIEMSDATARMIGRHRPDGRTADMSLAAEPALIDSNAFAAAREAARQSARLSAGVATVPWDFSQSPEDW